MPERWTLRTSQPLKPYVSEEDRNKIFLFVPYHYKDQAKAEGAKWDEINKKWYVENDKPERYNLIKKWVKENFEEIPTLTSEKIYKLKDEYLKKIYLWVPFTYKDQAKNEGVKWCAKNKQWYILENHPNKDYLIKEYDSNNFRSTANGHIRLRN